MSPVHFILNQQIEKEKKNTLKQLVKNKDLKFNW